MASSEPSTSGDQPLDDPDPPINPKLQKCYDFMNATSATKMTALMYLQENDWDVKVRIVVIS
jgi:hypothetical protein